MKYELVIASFGPGSDSSIHIDAANESEALSQARGIGLSVLSIRMIGESLKDNSSRIQFSLLQFSQEFLALLHAGMNMYEAVATLASKERRPGALRLLRDILSQLESGAGLSDALASKPSIFPDIYVATIRAAERSGDVPMALTRFIEYQAQLESIKKKVVAAAVYPCSLFAVGTGVTLFLLCYVVPRFSGVYQGSGRDIPWLSQQLLLLGKAISANGGVLGVVVVTLVVAFIWALLNHRYRSVLISRLLLLPILDAKAAEFRLARFYRAVSLLLYSGIPVSKGLSMAEQLLNSEQQLRLARARQAVVEGQPLSVALVANELATPIAESLLKVGERTGRLGDMFERAARFHDEEFGRWVEIASRLIEPALMTFMGLLIGGIVVLMYMPIFDLAGALG